MQRSPGRLTAFLPAKMPLTVMLGLFMLVALGQGRASAFSLINDSETEALLADYSLPIWRASGIDPNAVSIYLVNDQTVNAFVSGGQNLFIHTGLITEVDTPSELIGVIAHETGHMAGGHLTRSAEAMEGAAIPYYASMILGIGAIAAGAPDAGMAIIAGGAQVVQRGVLSYSREQESRADQAGATYLERAGLSGKGMLDLFASFRDQEALTDTQQDPFVRSHPISEDRLAALQDRVESSPYFNKKDSPESVERLKLVQAKLHGFIDDPVYTFNRYPTSDNSIYAHYARTVAYHKMGKLDASLQELEPLLAAQPKNPYFWELKGQVLFESGKIEPSIIAYRKSLSLKPNDAFLELGLAQSILARDSDTAAKEAIPHLETSIRARPDLAFPYYQLSLAYGRLNEIGMAELATAQYHDVRGNTEEARMHAIRAQKLLKTGSPDWIRAQDIATAERDPRRG
ncbi:MAG: M48 family metalloprotease [Rhizobiales bacterium]|nr:M48 family metalloprotease [Hyphomicrobiales bacterium]